MADNISSVRFETFIQVSLKYFTWEGILQDANITNVSDKGTQFEITCPFHEDKRPSCRLNKVTGQYHCFSCGRKGTYTRFLWELNGKTQNYALYCEQVLRARPDIQKSCGFSTIVMSEKSLDPAFEKRRIFTPGVSLGSGMTITTLHQRVKSMGDSWENMVTSMTLLQHGLSAESVYATMKKQNIAIKAPTEQVGLMDLLNM